MVVNPPAMNINYPLPSSNTNTSNSRILQVFFLIHSSSFSQPPVTMQLIKGNMSVVQQFAESNMPMPQG